VPARSGAAHSAAGDLHDARGGGVNGVGLGGEPGRAGRVDVGADRLPQQPQARPPSITTLRPSRSSPWMPVGALVDRG
jgi:hypothetical protein